MGKASDRGRHHRPGKIKFSVIIFAAAAIMLASAAVLACIAGSAIYGASFKRTNSSEPLLRTIGEFPGLMAEQCSFASSRGQKLAGYKYYRQGLKPAGVVIIAHGLGVGGQCVYMEVADYFVSHGYLVFAYDATAMDKSEGDTAVGMQQGVLDLASAIDYVEHDAEMKKYPLFLFGHSWGAYCVGAVLNVHPEVRAVAAVSGFDSTIGLYRCGFDETPQKRLLGKFLLPYFRLLEKFKFGKYADYTSMSGFAHSKAGVMVIHSRDDRNVPIGQGLDLYYAKYGHDPRFRFKRYEYRGHMYIFYKDAACAYDRKFVAEPSMQPTDYAKTHKFDKKIGYDLDQQLFGEILHFYDSCNPNSALRGQKTGN